ncbi:hypothetical protein W97_01964 [Coniosporium apollinis CBS 100218]|uniref:U-box domain-containing protein n=1 Tax=Coniosporium apollinis (strain CBS 100218) TaxID=1168221 RepID=R7YLQ1_CONA1|nr:uncharacterized protein W97_01964 [Coniosporium apollinis CBS 100218]EON62739.1 hypothetical protein W97_01964 [Coniosporium apollinis CBS 100218]
MADIQSDADKIRNKRLAKLGGQGPSQPSSTSSTPPAAASATPPEAENESALPAPQARTDSPSSNGVPSSDVVSQTTPVSIPRPASGITITSKTSIPQKREIDDGRPRSRQGRRETLEEWEDHTLGNIFKVTLDPRAAHDAHGNALIFLEGVRSDLKSEGAPIRLSIGVLDQAITEAASSPSAGTPLDYLLGCWKRVSRFYRSLRSGEKDDPKYNIIKEARRLCMSYCIFAVTLPEMFGQEPSEVNPLAQHLLVDPDNDRGLCHDFLSEAVSRFSEDDSVREALVGAVEQISRDMSKMTMNDNYKPYILALRNFVRYPPLLEALANSERFLPADVAPQDIETDTLLGPFFRLSPTQPEVALNYFSSPKTRDKAYILNAQKALRMSLQTHQDELFEIANHFVRNKLARERILDWFALVVNSNHKRRALRPDPNHISSDGFMINVTVVLDRLFEPVMDATFSKIDRIDVEYLRRNPRVSIQDETKINADQTTSDRYYAQKAEGTTNFITEVYFLAVAAHHYGTEAANIHLVSLQRQIKQMEKEIERFELERHKFVANPHALSEFERHLKKYKDQLERSQCAILATQGVLLDETAQGRSMQIMRYLIVWLLRLVSPGVNYPKQPLRLPLPKEQPEAFKCLPEYFVEDLVDNFKFITRNMPHIITSTQCEELMMICITFLQSSEYIKNPYLKSGLVTILFNGVWPIYGRPKGVLGDVLLGSRFAEQHLLHALMKFYIEAESTGTHTQFFDKFNIRYEIFQVIKCIWSNPVYRQNLGTESRVNVDFFVRFVNLLLNDVTFVLDESFTAFSQIHNLSKELSSGETLDENARKEKEEALEAAKGRAKSYMQLTNETVAMLKLFTEALADSFTMPEIVQRLADMLDYNLDAMVGPKQSNLRIENPQEYNFNPKQLLAEIIDVYLNLREKENFILAVARDGRSYKPSNFAQATTIMKRFALKSPEELDAWEDLASKIQAAKEADEQAEEDLGEIPDEFLDPLVYTLMEDPVILPSSRTTIDRSTIRSHLLSDPTDPFNRVPLKIEDVRPDVEMKKRIDAFRAEKRGARRVPGAGDEPMDTS